VHSDADPDAALFEVLRPRNRNHNKHNDHNNNNNVDNNHHDSDSPRRRRRRRRDDDDDDDSHVVDVAALDDVDANGGHDDEVATTQPTTTTSSSLSSAATSSQRRSSPFGYGNRLEAELAQFDITKQSNKIQPTTKSTTATTTTTSTAAPTTTTTTTTTTKATLPKTRPKTLSFSHEVLVDAVRRNQVKDAFLHAWRGYVKCAWGQDELHPIACTAQNTFQLGLTILDSLSTLYIMGLTEEFQRARDWVAEKLNVRPNINVSVFETTIRCLGGLLSAYDLSKDRVFLDKARALGDALLAAFDANNVPSPFLNLQTGHRSSAGWHSGSVVLAEVGTLQVEFLTLAYHTGEAKYAAPAMNALDRILAHTYSSVPHGLFPNFLSTAGDWNGVNSNVAMGALGDSFYEYLLKVWLLTGKKYDRLRRAYVDTYRAVQGSMKQRAGDLVYISELYGNSPTHKMDHLACFSGGMFALGSVTGAHRDGDDEGRDALQLGADVAKTCMEMYHITQTKLPGEAVHFSGGRMQVAGGAVYSLQRPETAETLMYLYRLTRDEKYREYGGEIIDAIERHSKVANGFSGLRDVNAVPPPLDDFQQSFLLAETFKYLYLLFESSDVVPLEHVVFNTEAHPVSVFENPDAPVLQQVMKAFL
jgi:mannosyl-oligosaccharide alpha-1,2-mannosidase